MRISCQEMYAEPPLRGLILQGRTARRCDSNSRDLSAFRFSRPAQSTALPPLRSRTFAVGNSLPNYFITQSEITQRFSNEVSERWNVGVMTRFWSTSAICSCELIGWRRSSGLSLSRRRKAARPFADVVPPGAPQIASKSCMSI